VGASRLPSRRASFIPCALSALNFECLIVQARQGRDATAARWIQVPLLAEGIERLLEAVGV